MLKRRSVFWMLSCVLLASACATGPSFAAFTVEIISPTIDPYPSIANIPIFFLAMAREDGEECREGDVTFSWDFDDNDTANGNPVEHEFDELGIYGVTVTATKGGQGAEDTVYVQIYAHSANPNFTLSLDPTPEGPGKPVCDWWNLELVTPGTDTYTAVWVKYAYVKEDGQDWREYDPDPGATSPVKIGYNPTVTETSRTFRGLWWTFWHDNFPTQIYLVCGWQGLGPELPTGEATTNIVWARPWNTTVEAWSEHENEPQLLFFDPECTVSYIDEPKVNWDADHMDWTDEFENEHFDYWMYINNLYGSNIYWKLGYQADPGEGSDSWDGSLWPPPPGTASMGIYSFQMRFRHAYGAHNPGPCSPVEDIWGDRYDKPGRLEIQDFELEANPEFNTANDYIEVDFDYKLNYEAFDCFVTLFAVNWDDRDNDHSVNPFVSLGAKDLPTTAGLHEITDLRWNVDPELYDRYWWVVEAKENRVDGMTHRDRKPDWAIAKGAARNRN